MNGVRFCQTPNVTDSKVVSVSREIASSPAEIFAFISDLSKHSEFDGSDTVLGSRDSDPEPLVLGSTFGMDMRFGPVPYRMTSEVVEFVQDKSIAWRHFGHHVWRYELEPTDTGTKVTETFDWGVARFPPFYKWLNYPERHRKGMTKTLENLESLVANT